MGVYDRHGNSLVENTSTGMIADSFWNSIEYPKEVGYRKSRQLVNLKWTPKGAVPQQGGGSYFPANTEQSGLLYSDTYGINKIVGYDVSLRTFMTAVNNPYSLLYTENINPSHSRSAYGITYTYGDANSGAYFGTACNHFAEYCVGEPMAYSSYDILNYAHGDGYPFIEVYNQSAYGVELMDLLVQPGHVRLVTAVTKNERGVVTSIQTSEAWTSGCRDNAVMTAEAFNTWMTQYNYKIFRCKNLYKNIDYKKSPFVAVEDESITPYVYNDDICTFAGDYACFAEGDLLHVNYTKGDYAQMEIYKDDTLLETITLDASANVHDVDLTAKNYTYGKYKARLKNGSTYSDYTYWEILNASISLSEDKNTLTFSSVNGIPLFWMWIKSTGYTYKKVPVTDAQVLSGTVNVSDRNGEYPQFKMVFQGDYGRIARIIT